MSDSCKVSSETLSKAFEAAEAYLRDAGNDVVAETIANEVGVIRYESILDSVLAESLRGQNLDTRQSYSRIDLAVIDGSMVAVAIECKGMIANSHSRNGDAVPLDVHGILTKLEPSKRSTNCVKTDMDRLTDKIPRGQRCSHLQVFVPVIYELYRTGGEEEWHRERKPWTSHSSFRDLRTSLKQDLIGWFHRQDDSCELLYATTEPIFLKRANEFWLRYSKAEYPKYHSLEAYVQFFAFFREVRM